MCFTIETIIPGTFAVVLLGGSMPLLLNLVKGPNLAFVLPFRALPVNCDNDRWRRALIYTYLGRGIANEGLQSFFLE